MTDPCGLDGVQDLNSLVEYRDCDETQVEMPFRRHSISRASVIDFLRIAVAVLVIPEIPRLAWHMRTHLPWHMRGVINSEYLLLLAFAFLFPTGLMVALLTAELVIVAIEPMAALYNVPFHDAFGVLGNLALLPGTRLAVYACLLVLYGLICVGLLNLTVDRRRLTWARPLAVALMILAISPVMADMADGRYFRINMLRSPSDLDRLLPYRATTMPVFQLAKELVIVNAAHDSGLTTTHAIPSTLSHALSELSATDKPNIVLVLAESWGLADDERINQTEYAPYLTPAIAAHYRVEIGKTPFHGGTIAAEFRELCGETRGFDVLAEPADHLKQCLPAKLNREGYTTMAVHGFSSLMFNRKSWYSRFGFQSETFLEDFGRYPLTRCNGAFNGICDADVSKWIGDKLLATEKPSPTYIHWVTLNSHLPIAPLPRDVSREDCTATEINDETSFCSWFEKSLIVQRSVAQLATQKGLPPTVFVIVGDHAPPFMDETVRSRFSSTDVPYVILLPKAS